jgi:glycosyltransferase involved in cell wall biosynthesis
MTLGQPFSIVCLSSQEWHVDLPTNRQQIMRRAAARGHNVLFVETGNFLGHDLARLIRSPDSRPRRNRLLSTEAVGERIRIRRALNVVPWGHKYSLAASINGALTRLLLRRIARGLPKPTVYWVYDPCALSMVAGDFVIYDCVDDYAEQSGSSGRRRALMTAADRKIARVARLVFTTATPLYERHREWNDRTYLVGNVGDYSHFSSAIDRGMATPELLELPRPLIGFAGNFLPSKVDLDLLETLARARPDWTLVLIGPERPGASEQLHALAALSNVVWLGKKPYERLPAYVAAFDVALIPYLANTYTRSCFPLKVFEYLAAGKPVVASGLPELAGMEPDVVVADTPSLFLDAVASALNSDGDKARHRRRELAQRNSWETKTERLLGLVTDEFVEADNCSAHRGVQSSLRSLGPSRGRGESEENGVTACDISCPRLEPIKRVSVRMQSVVRASLPSLARFHELGRRSRS